MSNEPIREGFVGRNSIWFDRTTEFTSTSYLTEGSIEYLPQNLEILSLAEPWVEGVPGNGEKEIITLESYSEEFKIKRKAEGKPYSSLAHNYEKLYCGLLISIGYVSYSKPYLYEYNSRPKTIRLFNDSLDMLYHLEDTPNFQYIDLDGLYNEIHIEIIDVYQGLKYEDTCLNFIIPNTRTVKIEE